LFRSHDQLYWVISGRNKCRGEPGVGGFNVQPLTWLTSAKREAVWKWDEFLGRAVILPGDASQKAIKPVLRITDRHRDIHWLRWTIKDVRDKTMKPSSFTQRGIQIGQCFLSVEA